MAARAAFLAFVAAVVALSPAAAAQAPRPADEATADWVTQAIRYVNAELRRIEQLPNPTCDETTVALVNLMTYYRDREDLFPAALVKAWEERVDRTSGTNCKGPQDHGAQAAATRAGQHQPQTSPPAPPQTPQSTPTPPAPPPPGVGAWDEVAIARQQHAIERVEDRLERMEAAAGAGQPCPGIDTHELVIGLIIRSDSDVLSPALVARWRERIARAKSACGQAQGPQPQSRSAASPAQPQQTPQSPLLAPPREYTDWEREMRARQQPQQQEIPTPPPGLPSLREHFLRIGGGKSDQQQQQTEDNGGNPIIKGLNILGGGNSQPASDSSVQNQSDNQAAPANTKRKKAKKRSKRNRCDINQEQVPADCPNR